MNRITRRINTLTVLAVALLAVHIVGIVGGVFVVGSVPLAIVWVIGWTAFDLALIFNPWRKKQVTA